MQVPTYERQVTQQVMPDIQIPQNDIRRLDLGALTTAQQGFGNALTSDSAVLAQQQEKMQLQQNAIAVNQAKASAINNINTAMYDPDNGILNKQGTQAVGASGMAKLSLQNAYDQAINSDVIGDNPIRKAALQQELDPLVNSYQRIADEHEYKQTQVAMKQSFDAAIQSDQNSAVLNYNQTHNAVDANGQPIKNDDGTQQQVYLADTPMKAIASDAYNYFKSQGMPDDAIQANIQNLYKATITQGVKAALANNDFTGASNWLNRYGHDPTKMDEETYNVLKQDIQKQYAPIQSRLTAQQMWTQSGNNLTAAMKMLSPTDPNYSMISTDLHAMDADAKSAKVQADKDKMTAISKAFWNISDMQTATAAANKLVADGVITPEQAIQLEDRTKSKIALSQSPEYKKWTAYENNGGLSRDLDTIDEYNNNIASGVEITPALQAKADAASTRLAGPNGYWSYSSGGTWNAQAADDAGNKASGALSACWAAVEPLAEQGLTRQQIMDKITPTLDKLGIDHDWFYGTVDWGKMGKKRGGVPE